MLNVYVKNSFESARMTLKPDRKELYESRSWRPEVTPWNSNIDSCCCSLGCDLVQSDGPDEGVSLFDVKPHGLVSWNAFASAPENSYISSVILRLKSKVNSPSLPLRLSLEIK